MKSARMLNAAALLMSVLIWCLGAGRVQASERVHVQIEVVVDSVNTIQAQIEVEKGINGRDLLDRLFQIEYMDASRKFIIGIAGFRAQPRKKEFWKLEIDGELAQVGIADVEIEAPMTMRWQLSTY